MQLTVTNGAKVAAVAGTTLGIVADPTAVSIAPAAAYAGSTITVTGTNFIVGYPGETEADHDQLVRFLEEARLDWCGFFAYSPEEGTYATTLDGDVPASLRDEWLHELRELQDGITAEARDALIGTTVRVLVDEPGIARSFREAPEIDGTIEVPEELPVGSFAEVTVVDALGPDLVAERVRP